MNDWPEDVGKPELPAGYQWGVLGKAMGLGPPNPWYVRVLWTSGVSGKTHVLRADYLHKHYQNLYDGLDCAMSCVLAHREKRMSAPNKGLIA